MHRQLRIKLSVLNVLVQPLDLALLMLFYFGLIEKLFVIVGILGFLIEREYFYGEIIFENDLLLLELGPIVDKWLSREYFLVKVIQLPLNKIIVWVFIIIKVETVLKNVFKLYGDVCTELNRWNFHFFVQDQSFFHANILLPLALPRQSSHQKVNQHVTDWLKVVSSTVLNAKMRTDACVT